MAGNFSDHSVICVTLSGKVHWSNDTEPTDLVILLNESLDNNENLEIVASDCTKQSGSNDVAVLVTWFVFLSILNIFRLFSINTAFFVP